MKARRRKPAATPDKPEEQPSQGTALAGSHRRGGCTVAEAAAHIDLTQRRFFDLLDAGVFRRKAKGGYALDEVRVAYIRYLRERAAGRGDGQVELPLERALLARKQAESIELRNSILRREFAPVEPLARLVERAFGVVRERALTMVGKLADALAMRPREEVESILKREVTEMLDELSTPAELVRHAAERGTHSAMLPSAEATAGPKPN